MQPVLFLSHGGGPLPLLGDPEHRSLIESFKQVRQQLTKPDAIIVFSAHWEAENFTVSFNPEPDMLYDYFGFPPESYEIQYPAKNSTDIAQEAFNLLEQAGLHPRKELERGYDHGVFVPLKLLFPDADIPVIPISLNSNLSPEQHIQLGNALQPLREKNILFIGSGMQTHNLRMLFQAERAFKQEIAAPFTHWIDDTLSDTTLTESDRAGLLADWVKVPNARMNHPREEHLIPLHAVYGVASKPVTDILKSELMDAPIRCYVWQ